MPSMAMARLLSSRSAPLRSAFPLRTTRLFDSPLQRRSFHQSQPHQFVEVPVALASSLFHAVHFIGLPWVLSIPATALVVRTFLGFPQQFWVAEQQRRISVIYPVLMAWSRVYRGKLMNKEKLGPETPFAAIVELDSKNNKLLKATRKQMYKSWKIKPWAKYTPITLLPVWLSMIEALRRMSGFPSLFGSENTISAPLEPSLATEGALWFPDLLVADPYYVLPVMLSATIYVNLISGWKATTREELAAMENRQRRQAKTFNALRRVLQCAALASGPIAMYSGAPAGVLIYWISSTAIATMQRRILLAGRSTAPPKPAVDNGIAILKSKSATST